MQKISEVKDEIHTMNDCFASVDNRLVAVETKLGMVSEAQREIRSRANHTQRQISNRVIDYAFKLSWFVLGLVALFVFVHRICMVINPHLYLNN